MTTPYPYIPPTTGDTHRWCTATPQDIYQESLNNEIHGFITRNGMTVKLNTDTLIITVHVESDSITALAAKPYLLEATTTPDHIWTGRMWILNEPCDNPDMTILALTIHRTLNPPDYEAEILHQGVRENFYNFTRFAYNVTNTPNITDRQE